MSALAESMMRLNKLRATMNDYRAEGKQGNFLLAFDVADPLVEIAIAAYSLRMACDTGYARGDGSQAGVRVPERDHVIALDKALRALAGDAP